MATAAQVANTEIPGAHPDVDLAPILAAWQEATDRLQATHETLRAEVGRLNDELQNKNRQLARRNRLADLGQMASHVAHEVRNGLVPITLYLGMLDRHAIGHEAIQSIIKKLKAGFTALEVTVNDLLQFTADRDPRWTAFDLHQFVVEICESLQPQFDAQQVRLELDIAAGMQMCADPEMLRRALLNLILNAVDAMPQGGELSITAFADSNGTDIEVADSGPGLTDDARRHLFEPFFSTKQGGTGLGLTIVERIAAAHGGKVEAQNCPQGGAALTVRIPHRTLEAAA